MKIIKEEFLYKVEEVVKLQGNSILEIGCGSGTRSFEIAKRCKDLTAIEPDMRLIAQAQETNQASNIEYQIGKAEKLDFADQMFDVAIFTLSLHHVPVEKMDLAINESIRVTKLGGYVIFLEPSTAGTFFEAEIRFDACDGDERKEKALAYESICGNKGYKEIAEIDDETVFQFDSADDFITSLNPKKSTGDLKHFLGINNYILRASRRINIFQTTK